MQILLGESDSFLHANNKASMIIVHVTLDSGKKVQFPYPAESPISELYESVKKISDEKIVVPASNKVEDATSVIPSEVKKEAEVPTLVPLPPSHSENEIHKECFVRCVKVESRGQGATVDLEVGKIYRVLSINGPTAPDGKRHATSYDVVDDEAGNTLRISVLPHEVVFYKKRNPPIQKNRGRPHYIVICPNCLSQMIAYKNDDGKYTGECSSCSEKSEHNPLKKRDDNEPNVTTSIADDRSRESSSVSTGF